MPPQSWRPVDALPQEARLLLLATRPGPRADDAVRALLETVRLDHVLALAYRHRVTSALYHGLVQPHRDALPPAFAAALQQQAFGATVQVLRVAEALHAVLDAFRNAGIDVLCLKGLAVGVLAYGEPALRKPGDLDLLIRRADFPAARRVLTALGYRPDVAAADAAEHLDEHHGYAFRGPQTDVDLHWNLAHLFQRVPTDFDALHARRLSVKVGRGPIPTLAREDHLLQLATHAVTHRWSALYLVADVAGLLRATDAMDWALVTRNAEAARSRRAIALGVFLAARLYGAPVPEALAGDVADPAVERLAADVQGWLFDADEPPLDRFVIHRFYLRTLDGWNDRAAYLADMARRGLRGEPS